MCVRSSDALCPLTDRCGAGASSGSSACECCRSAGQLGTLRATSSRKACATGCWWLPLPPPTLPPAAPAVRCISCLLQSSSRRPMRTCKLARLQDAQASGAALLTLHVRHVLAPGRRTVASSPDLSSQPSCLAHSVLRSSCHCAVEWAGEACSGTGTQAAALAASHSGVPPCLPCDLTNRYQVRSLELRTAGSHASRRAMRCGVSPRHAAERLTYVLRTGQHEFLI